MLIEKILPQDDTHFFVADVGNNTNIPLIKK